MTSLPDPPQSTSSSPPRPRTSSSPSSPARLSGLSVPESRPPLGQPGTSFVTQDRPYALILRVRSHRASSDAVASVASVISCSCLVASVCSCSSPCGASERTPAQPTTTRRITHPKRRAPKTAVRHAGRTTAPPPFACVLCYNTSEHPTLRSLAHLQGRLIHPSAWKECSRKFVHRNTKTRKSPFWRRARARWRV